MSTASVLGCYREPLAPDSIRLLRLLPSKDRTGPIHCELFHYSLQEISNTTHPYEALSYVWGSPAIPQYISIREHNSERGPCSPSENELSVTKNLHAALLRLRYQTHERVIWIDAVCINQNDQQEKEQQIQFMAKIYALANRVIVWLGEEAEDSNRALHWIRSAGNNQSRISSSNAADQQAVIALLQRPWFRRIWILQEVAAARYVLIMCGSMDIDGYAFCLGVDLFEGFSAAGADLKSLIRSVAYLIRGAIFRPSLSLSGSGRSSLNMYPLGELVDMYHTLEATVRLDKVYALLGMSTYDPRQAHLMPDYTISWAELFRRLTKYLLCEEISLTLAGIDNELAVIESKGCVLGAITRAGNEGLGLSSSLPTWERESVTVTQQQSPKPFRKGDLICLLSKASKPTIIRHHQDHFEIIAISFEWPNFPRQHLRFDHDFILIWDWRTTSGNSGYLQAYNRVYDFSTDLEGSLEKMNRIWNVAHALEDATEYEEARDRFREAIHTYETAFGIPHTGDSECGFTPLSWAAKNGHDAAVRLLAITGGVDLNTRDRLKDRTLLSWAAQGGHETVVKLLLETGKIEVNSRDKDGRTPLSLAAEAGNTTVVKLLLETSEIEVNSRDGSGRTLLSWAAGEGHETTVKLLLETGEAEVNSMDNYKRTPLSWAAKGGHETVVKLLLETGKAEVNSMDDYKRTPLSWAAQGGHETVVKLLLKTGQAEANYTDVSSRSPLSWAAEGGYETLVKLLLERGRVDVNVEDKYGDTPLSLATHRGHTAIVKLLREAGAVEADHEEESVRH